MFKKNMIFWLIAAAVLIFGACSGETASDTASETRHQVQEEGNADPVELTFMNSNANLTEEEFNDFFTKPLQEKFPHITLSRVSGSMNDLIAQNAVPDIILTSTTGIRPLQDLQIIEPLDPLIEKYNENLSRFDPIPLEEMRKYTEDGQILGLPYRMNFSALFYNQDIFDRFGVKEPEDGMTWDEAIQLSRQLTREVDGIQYIGLLPPNVDLMGFGLSLPYVNENNQAVLNTDKWQMVLRTAAELFSIPGYVKDGEMAGGGTKMFRDEQRLAMLTTWGDGGIGHMEQLARNNMAFEWDMATMPNFKEALGYAWAIDFHSLFISTTSGYKDEAYQVISYITNEEVQTIINRSGALTTLVKSDEVQREFGADLQVDLSKKNLNAIFGVKPSNVHRPQTVFDNYGRNMIRAAHRRVVLEGMDVVTSLRIAQEELNQHIQDQLGNSAN